MRYFFLKKWEKVNSRVAQYPPLAQSRIHGQCPMSAKKVTESKILDIGHRTLCITAVASRIYIFCLCVPFYQLPGGGIWVIIYKLNSHLRQLSKYSSSCAAAVALEFIFFVCLLYFSNCPVGENFSCNTPGDVRCLTT